MPVQIQSSGVVGVDAHLIRVEVDVTAGAFGFEIVGLPDTAVRESKQRVKSALRNSAFQVPQKRVVVNLGPAGVRKVGTGFDLAIALGILVRSGQVRGVSFARTLVIGELSLGGAVRPVRGVLAGVLAAVQSGFDRVVVPAANAGEAASVPGVSVVPATDLRAIVEILEGTRAQEPVIAPEPERPRLGAVVDLKHIRGQSQGRRAVEIAAAGAHNLLLVGPPGAGKTLLARCMHGLLPALDESESMEVSRIHSVAGLLPGGRLMAARPFRAPHHTSSRAAIVGGGSGVPGPGEVSLAHRGVLFLDELPEFPRGVREVLRQPLESGEITLGRSRGRLRFPARFQLVGTMNPCPCGYSGAPSGFKQCSCPWGAAERYARRLSGPLRDRFDLSVVVPPVSREDLLRPVAAEPSESVLRRVSAARECQARRFDGAAWRTNAEVPGDVAEGFCELDRDTRSLASGAMEKLGLSARGYHRALKVARTIADLDASPGVRRPHLAEAFTFKGYRP